MTFNTYWSILLPMMTAKQKVELKKLFDAHPQTDVLQWMVVTPALNNDDVWGCWEEWQDED